MAVCNDLREFSRTHEGIADLFSLLAVALLMLSIWMTLEFYQPVIAWLSTDIMMRTPILGLGLAMNAFAILGLLAVGSARFGDGEHCFGTFRGRRARHHERTPLSAWVRHMENVGRKHR